MQCGMYVSVMHFYSDIKVLFCKYIEVKIDGQMGVEVLVKCVKRYFSTGPDNSLSSVNLK